MVSILILQFVISFFAVFLKGFQHQHVIGGHYRMAFCTSYFMAVLDVAVVSFIVTSGWLSVIPVGTGAALGITSSMYLYRTLNKK